MRLIDQDAELLEENTGKTKDEFDLYVGDVWLSSRELLVLWLKQFGGMSDEDIADGLDIDASTVGTYLDRIRNKLERSEQTIQEIDERKL